MKTADDLTDELRKIDSKGYKAYKDIKGEYYFQNFILFIDYVQGDPFASPSRIRVRVDQKKAEFPNDSYRSKSREIALRDFLTRRFHEESKKHAKGNRGSGKSGLVSTDRPGQEILERNSVFVNDDYVEVRFAMGLPAFGRKIAGIQAQEMFTEELPSIVESALYFRNLNEEKLFEHIRTSEDADFLRNRLDELGLIGFVEDGSILPRASGIDPRPLTDGRVIPFESPESLRIKVELPNRGETTGMGIPEGVTLIVGGGYHGKSTLLRALELGVYNHIPGDGRELVVSNPRTHKIRAEDGRQIVKVNISPFISNLPFGEDTTAFSSEDASGSTSQAANIMEALEIGAETLLIDEDTSATNFMIRDRRMQELVSKDMEPITPFIDKVRQLYDELGVSTVLVIGGSGDYFDVADCVICMIEYKPFDKTVKAHAIADMHGTERTREGGRHFGEITPRVPVSESVDASKGKRKVRIKSRGIHTINFGTTDVDLSALEQLVDSSQTRAIGDAMYYSKRYMDGSISLREVVKEVMKDLQEKSLDVLSPMSGIEYAQFRELELAAAINRLRTLSVTQRLERGIIRIRRKA